MPNEFEYGHLVAGRPSIQLKDGKIAVGRDGLVIGYRGDESCPYGAAATKGKKVFIGIVLHHTAPDHDLDWYVKYQIDGDPARKGHFGYHFFIGDDGQTLQGAPLSKRTNHISPKKEVRKVFRAEFFNTNTIGISAVGAGKREGYSPTPAQVDATEKLVFALCDLYGIPFDAVVGHGEIQSNRMKTEGTAVAKAIRG